MDEDEKKVMIDEALQKIGNGLMKQFRNKHPEVDRDVTEEIGMVIHEDTSDCYS